MCLPNRSQPSPASERGISVTHYHLPCSHSYSKAQTGGIFRFREGPGQACFLSTHCSLTGPTRSSSWGLTPPTPHGVGFQSPSLTPKPQLQPSSHLTPTPHCLFEPGTPGKRSCFLSSLVGMLAARGSSLSSCRRGQGLCPRASGQRALGSARSEHSHVASSV